MTNERRSLARHPLAMTSLVLSALGFFPLVVVGGLIGAPLGAVAGRRIQAEPERWEGLPLARIAVAVGLFTGAVPVAVIMFAMSDDWGFGPLGLVVAYVAVVAYLAGGKGRSGAAFAAGGVGGVLLGVLMVLALVYAVTWVFVFMAREIVGAIFEGIFGG